MQWNGIYLRSVEGKARSLTKKRSVILYNNGTAEHRGTACRGCRHAEVGNGAGDIKDRICDYLEGTMEAEARNNFEQEEEITAPSKDLGYFL